MSTKSIVQKREAALRIRAEGLADKVRELAGESKAADTRRGYESDWAAFQAFAAEFGQESLPADPELIAIYIAHLFEVGKKVSTIERALYGGISHYHKRAGYPRVASHEAIQEVMQGVRRAAPQEQKKEQKKALRLKTIRRWLATLDETNKKDLRDRALILVGHIGAFRRSELVALDVQDLEFRDDGIYVTVRKSKTDQEGEGMYKWLPNREDTADPVRAVRAWLDISGIEAGALFRGLQMAKGGDHTITDKRISSKLVALIVKEICRKLEMSELECQEFSAHSLRAGFVTDATAAGASTSAIKRQTGHKSDKQVEEYRRLETISENNAAGML